MERVKFLLGFLWALPITLVCTLFYTLPFTLLGWYKFLGWFELAWVWQVTEKAPGWLQNLWKDWAGHAMGNVVVMKRHPLLNDNTRTSLKHELTHCVQCMRLGVFQPIMYALNYLMIKVAMRDSDPYWDNPAEIDARRHAGQVIDVVGLTKKKNDLKN